MSVDAGTPEEMEAAVMRRLEGRERVLVVQAVGPGAFDLAERMERALPAGSMLALRWHGTPEDSAAASRINGERDLLLPTLRLLLIAASDKGHLREIRRLLVDIVGLIDLGVMVTEGAKPGRLEETVAAINKLTLERTAWIELTGLLAANPQEARVSLDKAYVGLVYAVSVTMWRQYTLRRWDAWLPESAKGSPPRGFLLLGDPGAGKTTALRHLAATYAAGTGDPLACGPRLSLLVSLASYARARRTAAVGWSVLDHVAATLLEEGIAHAAEALRSPQPILLLADGLDEVRDEIERGAIAAELAALAEGNARVVVSMRTVLADSVGRTFSAFQQVVCRAPTRDQQAHLLTELFRARHAGRPEADAEAVLDRIDADGALADIAENPLLLAFLGLLHQLEGRIPDQRALVYHRLSEILIHRWGRARGTSLGGGRVLHHADPWRILGALSWWLLETGRVEVTPVEIEEAVQRIEIERGETPAAASAQAVRVREMLGFDTALLVASGDGRWRFLHPTLVEYFAAVDAARGGPRWRALLQHPFETGLREVVLFAAGELGRRADDERLGALANAVLSGARRTRRSRSDRVALLLSLVREDPGFPRSTLDALVDEAARVALGCGELGGLDPVFGFLDAIHWRSPAMVHAERLAEQVARGLVDHLPGVDTRAERAALWSEALAGLLLRTTGGEPLGSSLDAALQVSLALPAVTPALEFAWARCVVEGRLDGAPVLERLRTRPSLPVDPVHLSDCLYLAGAPMDELLEVYRASCEGPPVQLAELTVDTNVPEFLVVAGDTAGARASVRHIRDMGAASPSENLALDWILVVAGRLDGASSTDCLVSLRERLRAGHRHASWDFDVPLRRLAHRLSPADHAFLTALAQVVNDRAPMESLDAFPLWRDSPP